MTGFILKTFGRGSYVAGYHKPSRELIMTDDRREAKIYDRIEDAYAMVKRIERRNQEQKRPNYARVHLTVVNS